MSRVHFSIHLCGATFCDRTGVPTSHEPAEVTCRRCLRRVERDRQQAAKFTAADREIWERWVAAGWVAPGYETQEDIAVARLEVLQ